MPDFSGDPGGGSVDIGGLDAASTPSSGDLFVLEQGGENKKLDVDDLPGGAPADNSVTNAKLADVATATIKGRSTAGSGDPEDLSAAQVRTLLSVEENADVTDADNVGTVIHGATGKTTPVDADTVPLIDSAASNVLKKLSWANIKATLKTYFDTLYLAITGGTLSGQLNFSGTDHAGVKLLSLTTTQRNGLTPAAGMAIYNSTTGNIEGYDGSSWVDLGASAAGWDGDITDADIDGATDIGADLVDADLIIVDDGGVGTNRKSAVSRVWTYIGSKLSGATGKTTPVDADSLNIIDSAASNAVKTLTFTNLKAFLKTYFDGLYSRRWTLVAAANYTATPASTSTITMSDTSDMYVGAPIRYSDSGGPWYAIVTAVSANTNITIAGAPLDTGDNITALHVGRPEMVVKQNINESTQLYGASIADIGYGDQWDHADAFLVTFYGWHEGADGGAAQPKVNVEVGGAAVSTADTNNGIQLGSAATTSALNRVQNSAVAINTTNYAITRGDRIQGTCTAAGTNGDAEYLHLTILAVLA